MSANQIKVAEAQGFEPWEDFHPRRFSRPVHSTTLPSFRVAIIYRPSFDSKRAVSCLGKTADKVGSTLSNSASKRYST